MKNQESYLQANIDKDYVSSEIHSYKSVYLIHKKSNVWRWVVAVLLLLLVAILLPWTQNIRAKGLVTTLRQEQRPQELNTMIGGKIEKWYVKEGDFVQKGDTIVKLSEIKVEYFDPNLLNRTKEQIAAKEMSAKGYLQKAGTADAQIAALNQGRVLKLSSLDNKILQQNLKVKSDSMDLLALNNELSVYKRQLDAGKEMLDNGAISLVDFEKRKVNYQNGFSKKISSENKLAQSRQELINLRIEKNSVIMDYTDKISKAEGDRFSSLSAASSTDADVSKLQNTYSSYNIRNGLYYITAPQSGQITKAKKGGIGEMVKEGEMLVEVVPDKIQYAVELYVEPMDLPLVNNGQKVRFLFDGFPAIVFSGWPSASYGTFGGIVSAVETSVSANGKFRVLVIEDTSDRKWPKALRIGNGAQGIALLKDVPIYYELWRHINGFPPDFYKPGETEDKDNKKKKG